MKSTIPSEVAELQYAGDADLEHQPCESRIGNDEIAASSQDEQRQLPRTREFDRFDDVGFAARLDEVARRPSDAQSRERGERNLFADQHGAYFAPVRNALITMSFG